MSTSYPAAPSGAVPVTASAIENGKPLGTPDRIDIDRHNDRTFVRVNGVLAAVRDEATGSIVWHFGHGLTERDQAILREKVFSKMPWRPSSGPVNRAQRRRAKHAKKAKR